MKKMVLFFVCFNSLLTLNESYSQIGRRGGARPDRMFNIETVETMNAKVVSIDTLGRFGRSGNSGIHLFVKNNKEQISVHLGPASHLREQNFKMSVKDSVRITGSRITYEGKMVIIAKEVQKGNQILKLRDNMGLPLWEGWHRNWQTR